MYTLWAQSNTTWDQSGTEQNRNIGGELDFYLSLLQDSTQRLFKVSKYTLHVIILIWLHNNQLLSLLCKITIILIYPYLWLLWSLWESLHCFWIIWIWIIIIVHYSIIHWLPSTSSPLHYQLKFSQNTRNHSVQILQYQKV